MDGCSPSCQSRDLQGRCSRTSSKTSSRRGRPVERSICSDCPTSAPTSCFVTLAWCRLDGNYEIHKIRSPKKKESDAGKKSRKEKKVNFLPRSERRGFIEIFSLVGMRRRDACASASEPKPQLELAFTFSSSLFSVCSLRLDAPSGIFYFKRAAHEKNRYYQTPPPPPPPAAACSWVYTYIWTNRMDIAQQYLSRWSLFFQFCTFLLFLFEIGNLHLQFPLHFGLSWAGPFPMAQDAKRGVAGETCANATNKAEES